MPWFWLFAAAIIWICFIFFVVMAAWFFEEKPYLNDRQKLAHAAKKNLDYKLIREIEHEFLPYLEHINCYKCKEKWVTNNHKESCLPIYGVTQKCTCEYMRINYAFQECLDNKDIKITNLEYKDPYRYE